LRYKIKNRAYLYCYTIKDGKINGKNWKIYGTVSEIDDITNKYLDS
jgi:hypothetical protein